MKRALVKQFAWRFPPAGSSPSISLSINSELLIGL